MTHRVVIADAGPLIALARINSLNLLQGLFGRVLITRTIKEEILPPSTVGCFADAEILAHSQGQGGVIVVYLIQMGDWA